jgi:hypothetical protein
VADPPLRPASIFRARKYQLKIVSSALLSCGDAGRKALPHEADLVCDWGGNVLAETARGEKIKFY